MHSCYLHNDLYSEELSGSLYFMQSFGKYTIVTELGTMFFKQVLLN